MARIPIKNNTSTWRIQKFLGLNENRDGTASLKPGEFAEMKNFKITRGHHLQVRPGTHTTGNIFALTGETDRLFAETRCNGFWQGFAGGREVAVAAVDGSIYELKIEGGTARNIGTLNTADAQVSFFSFGDKAYVIGDGGYRSWDGGEESAFADVEPYAPILFTELDENGRNGVQVENVNRLTRLRRARYAPAALYTVYLPETNVSVVEVKVNDRVLTKGETENDGDYRVSTNHADYSVSVTFNNQRRDTETIEVTYSKGKDAAGEVLGMKFAEFYNGDTDSRVFLYGDGSSKTIYSGVRYDNGQPSAEYFPDLYEATIGDSAPITALVRYYGKLLAFKSNSAWSLQRDTIQTAEGGTAPAFYVQPMNRQFGNEAPGQVQILENNPLTVDAGSIYRWENASLGYLSNSESNAKRISGPVAVSLEKFSADRLKTFNRRNHQEFWFLQDGMALVLNYDANAWYYYEGLPFSLMQEIGGETYGLCDNGDLVHLSRDYRSDDGKAISCYAATGAIDFDRAWLQKFSPMVYITMQPEEKSMILVTAQTDKEAEIPEVEATGGVGEIPTARRAKLRCKNASTYRLIFKSNSTETTATVLETDVSVRYAGNAK